MKICFVLPNLAGGGAERVIVTLANELCKKYSISILIGNEIINDYEDLISKNIKIIYIAHNFKPGLINGLKFHYIVREIFNDFDIIHSNLTAPNLLVSFSKLLSFNSKYKLILTEHNNFKRRFEGFSGGLIKRVISYLYSFSDSITSVSKELSSEIENEINSNLVTIYNPIELTKIKKSRNLPSILPKRKGIKRFINVGRLISQKNQNLLIESFKLYKSINQYSELLIFGKGPLLEKLKNKIIDLDLEDSVFLMGFSENIYSELYNSDLFILTSSWEGFGNVIIESMASRCRVLSLDCDFGPREIIKNNRNGFIVPLTSNPNFVAKKIDIIISNNLNIIENAETFVEKFDIENIAKEYVLLYKKN